MNVVELKSVTRTYGDFVAVDRLSLAVREGEIFALLGPNGAGKTTLIGIICGLVNRTAGDVKVAGYDIIKDYLTSAPSSASPRKFARSCQA